MRAGSAPFARMWPWPRWLLATRSCASSTAPTPADTASWPMHEWVKPGTSPSRASDNAASSKVRMRRMTA